MQVINGEKVLSNASGQQIVLRGGKWVPFAPMGGSAPSAPAPSPAPQTASGLGQQISQGYENYIAKPATDVAARAFTDIGEKFSHPMQQLRRLSDPVAYADEATQPAPQRPVSPLARTAAEMVVPQTPTSAAIDSASLALPGVGAEKVLGEAAGPVRRALGTRLGRMAAGTGIGALADKATGGSGASGAAQAAAAFIPSETLAAGASKILNPVAEKLQQKIDTKAMGKAIGSVLPWIGKLEKPSDFEAAFGKGDQSGAVQGALRLLTGVKDTLSRQMKGHTFAVPTPAGMQHMTFAAADKLATDLQQGWGYTLGQGERAGWTARESRAVAQQIREHLSDGLNQIRKGLGDAYRKAGRQYDAAKTLVRMMSPEGEHAGPLGAAGVIQPKMLGRLRATKFGRLMYDLDRSLGQGTRDRLVKVLQRGYEGVGADELRKVGQHHWMGHAIGAGLGGAMGEMVGHPGLGVALGGLGGFLVPSGGKPFDPVGKVNPLVRFSGSPAEIAISHLMGEQLAPPEAHSGGGTNQLDKSRAEAMAPTPSASKRAIKLTKDLHKGKTPNVHRDLNRGRLSLDESNKLLQYASSSNPASIIAGIPLSEVLDAAETAPPEERRMLMPMIEQRMRAELPQEKNKTLASNLSRRFQQLQMSPDVPQQPQEATA